MENWISTHLYYTEDNFLIKNGIYPFIHKLVKEGLIKKYFFIRYSEKGPHVRLRLLVEENHIIYIVSSIDNFFSNFFMEYPSERKMEFAGFFPNNSIQHIDYEPEIERYGGNLAISIAEKHFQDSSAVVLDLLQGYDEWNISIAQGKAIQLYVAFFKAVNLPLDYVRMMLNIMSESHWKAMAQNMIGAKRDIVSVFSEKYNQNKAAITNYIKNLNTVIDSCIDDIPELAEFYNNVKKTDEELSVLALQNKIRLSEPHITENINVQKCLIYISFLHMLNNRLGLKNHDEGYISFVFKNSLDVLYDCSSDNQLIS